MPQYPIVPRQSVLVLFDMLNGYIRPRDPERAQQIAATGVVERCVEIMQAARAHGMPIVYANGSHRPGAEDRARTITDTDMSIRPWPDGPRRMNVTSPAEGSFEAQVIPELAPQPQDYIFPKRRWSAFAGTPLDLLLRELGADTILLAGGSTDVGVTATAYDAHDLGYNLVVLHDACQSVRVAAHEFCLERLFPRLARVMTVDEAIGLIQPAV